MTSKGDMAGLKWPIFACTTLDLEKFRNGRPHVLKWGQQWCSRRWTAVAHTYDGTCSKTQAPSVWFVWICCKLVKYIVRRQLNTTTNRTSGVWALPCTYMLTTDNRRSVQQCTFNIDQHLLPGDHTRRPALCIPRYCVRQRRAVHQRQQIYLYLPLTKSHQCIGDDV